MEGAFRAVYINGMFRPKVPISLPDQAEVELAIVDGEHQLFVRQMAELAGKSHSLDFLNHPEEDIYSVQDGQSVS